MGIAIRSGSPLSLRLAEPMWKLLAGSSLTISDIAEVDKDYMPGLLCIRNMEVMSYYTIIDCSIIFF